MIVTKFILYTIYYTNYKRMHTIIGLMFLSAGIFIYQRYIRYDSDILDPFGNEVGRKGKVKSDS